MQHLGEDLNYGSVVAERHGVIDDPEVGDVASVGIYGNLEVPTFDRCPGLIAWPKHTSGGKRAINLVEDNMAIIVAHGLWRTHRVKGQLARCGYRLSAGNGARPRGAPLHGPLCNRLSGNGLGSGKRHLELRRCWLPHVPGVTLLRSTKRSRKHDQQARGQHDYPTTPRVSTQHDGPANASV